MALYEGFFIDQCIVSVIARRKFDLGQTCDVAIRLFFASFFRTSGLLCYKTSLCSIYALSADRQARNDGKETVLLHNRLINQRS